MLSTQSTIKLVKEESYSTKITMPAVPIKPFHAWVTMATKQWPTKNDLDTLEDDRDIITPSKRDWCGRGGSHVDFKTGESVPLAEEKFLGHGVNGPVFSATCPNGELVAWKRIYCRRGVSSTARKEIDVLKRLNHKHIIQLVGTYTQSSYLGLLLWPVAITDLASFLAEVDGIQHRTKSLATEQTVTAENRMTKLLLPFQSSRESPVSAETMLRQSMGCLANAVAYLHKNSVRHKDLKPSNILLYPDGLRLTDFGTATDFTDFSRSATDGGDRGTPKYFSPETAEFEPCGRASDIFSLGCIFLEMLAVANQYPLESLKQRRPDGDRSFQANLVFVHQWFDLIESNGLDNFLLDEIRLMLKLEPKLRPTIDHILHHLKLIELLSKPESRPVFHGECCRFGFPLNFRTDNIPSDIEIEFDLTLDGIKDPPSWAISIRPDGWDNIEHIYYVLHDGARNPPRILTKPPFELSSHLRSAQILNIIEMVGILIVLKSASPQRTLLSAGSQQVISDQGWWPPHKYAQYQRFTLVCQDTVSRQDPVPRWNSPKLFKFSYSVEDFKRESILSKHSYLNTLNDLDTAYERNAIRNVLDNLRLGEKFDPDSIWEVARIYTHTCKLCDASGSAVEYIWMMDLIVMRSFSQHWTLQLTSKQPWTQVIRNIYCFGDQVLDEVPLIEDK